MKKSPYRWIKYSCLVPLWEGSLGGDAPFSQRPRRSGHAAGPPLCRTGKGGLVGYAQRSHAESGHAADRFAVLERVPEPERQSRPTDPPRWRDSARGELGNRVAEAMTEEHFEPGLAVRERAHQAEFLAMRCAVRAFGR